MSSGERPPDPSPKPPDEAATFASLLPPGAAGPAAEMAAGFDFVERAAAARRDRPYVVLNMASTVDGRATIDGRSGTISERADRQLFHALRASFDGVMAGAGTVRVERYGRIIANQSTRRARVARGMTEEPLACIVSGRVSLPADTPLLCEPAARVVILTPSSASLPDSPAQVEYVRAERDGQLDLPQALAELRSRFGLDTLLCEGGPHLNATLLRAGLVDELMLSLAPKLAGGEDGTGEALRIVAGVQFERPVELELLSALESDSYLFLRYGVRERSGAGGVGP